MLRLRESFLPYARGSCLCQAVKFRAALPSLWCAHCHCTRCRRAHGAAFVTWVGFSREGFEVEAGRELLKTYTTSAGAERSFCTSCGSTLTFSSDRWPGEIHVVLANLDDPIDRAPEGHAYKDNRVEWGILDRDPIHE